MVKFTKNGSTAVTAAVKLARAHTGKKTILRCSEQPFFHMMIGLLDQRKAPRGVTDETRKLTKLFSYNNIDSLKKVMSKYKNKIACVVLEPSSTECPKISRRTRVVVEKKYAIESLKLKHHF